MDVFWIAALRPFLLFFVLACICLPVRYAVIWWMPEGKLKRLLLRRVDQRGRGYPDRR